MKKLLAAILLLIYFTVSTGFVVSVHYCMNKVDSVVLGNSNRDECGKCGMHIEDSVGCCKDDVKVVKMQVDHSFAKITAPDFSLQLPEKTFASDYFFTIAKTIHQKYPLANGPPLSDQDTYLLNCVFRI